MAKSSERLEAAKPKPEEASRVSHLVSALSMVVTLVAAAYAAELHLKVGLYFFAEQALALILGLCLAIIVNCKCKIYMKRCTTYHNVCLYSD